ncbi:MAG: HAMP domain-containing sensor histidine kinase, partial [Pseudomonadota bacterium]
VTADAGALTAYLIDNGLADRHALLARIDAFGIELDRLSTRLSSEDEAHYTSMEAAIGQAQSMFKWQLGGTLLLAIILIVVMMREIRHFRSAMVRTTADLQRAESASEAKSRFLTMMNHELRTPMNGVMGLLALTRQTGLTPRQDRLLLQAERAGRKMSDLLGDILDYSELQGESLKLRRAPVAMADLIGQLEIALAETVKEKAADIDISPNFDEPAAVLIDSERLCQAVRQILRYLIDMVETGQLRVEIHHRGTRLELSIQCDTAPVAGPGWQPEMVFSGEPRGTDRFASDAIGPAIARGLVARMGGVIELRRHAERRVDLILQIPAEPAPLFLQLARIETNSATSAALVFAMLDREGWQIWRAGEPDQPVTLVVVELGGQNEAALAARLRVQHPEAWLVAIGRAEQPALFDATCSSLTDPKVLLDAVSGQPRLSQVAS